MSDIDPCPDDEVLLEHVRGELRDEAVRNVVTCHLEYCSSCRARFFRFQEDEEGEEAVVKGIVGRLIELQAELKRNQAQGPIPGTLWRAVPETDAELFGPLLLVLSGDRESAEIQVAEVSEELSEADHTDLILQSEESGLRFVCMVRSSKTFWINPANLKAFAGRLSPPLAQQVVQFCIDNASPTEVTGPSFVTRGRQNDGSMTPDTGVPENVDGKPVEPVSDHISIVREGLVGGSEPRPSGKRSINTSTLSAWPKIKLETSASETVESPLMGRLLLWITPITKSPLRMAAALALVFLSLAVLPADAQMILGDVLRSVFSYAFRAGQLMAQGMLFAMANPVTATLIVENVPFPVTVASCSLMMIVTLSLAVKTQTNQKWLAVVPGGNLLLLIKMARVSDSYLTMLLFPALWLLAIHYATFDGILLKSQMFLCKIVIALLFPWVWPLVLLLIVIWDHVTLASGIANGFLVGLFLLGWFRVATGLVEQRGKRFVWAVLLFFPVTAPIAWIYLALSE